MLERRKSHGATGLYTCWHPMLSLMERLVSLN